VKLSDATVEATERVGRAAAEFFDSASKDKTRCTDPEFQYIGYQSRPAFDKELFQMRLAHEGDAHSPGWGGAAVALRDPARAGFLALGELALSVLTLACAAAGGGSSMPSTISALRERSFSGGAGGARSSNSSSNSISSTSSSSSGGWSQSNLSLFNYYAARECVHCPHHSDVGLITVIPTARGAAGLHVFDWQRECWLDVERGAPPNVAVVFGGESLGALTDGAYIPTMHEVSRLAACRRSMAFQLLAMEVRTRHVCPACVRKF
jgi:hypothetical protein